MSNYQTRSEESPIDGRFEAKMAGTRRLARTFAFCLLALGGGLSVPAMAQLQTPEQSLPSPELAQRLKKLESELRCLVCQNQTLADSPAGLAGDLRREVRSLVEQGKSDAEVKAFLQARYGDFVLYKPPVDSKTYLLWYGPFGLLFAAGLAALVVVRRRGSAPVPPQSAAPTDPQARARRLLDSDQQDGS